MIPKKLRHDDLASERQSLSVMLERAREVGDPIASAQLATRLADLDNELLALDAEHDNRASLALFLGGPKVVGSRGIDADFAGGVLEGFQDLVTRAFARAEIGEIAPRGPVPMARATNLMVTGVARGSFGFVLEEMSQQDEAFETSLKATVEQVSELIEHVADPEEEVFGEAVSELDERMVVAIRKFFERLSKAEATLRLVGRERDFSLTSADIERGLARVEALTINEEDGVNLTGRLVGLTPWSRRFEFLSDDGEQISGRVLPRTSKAIEENTLLGNNNPIGKHWTAEFSIKRVSGPNRPERTYYTLTRLLDEVTED